MHISLAGIFIFHGIVKIMVTFYFLLNEELESYIPLCSPLSAMLNFSVLEYLVHILKILQLRSGEVEGMCRLC